MSIISRLIHMASVPAVYASGFGFPTPARLASGGRANPYRVGVEPTGLLQRISKCYTYDTYSNAPGLSWRDDADSDLTPMGAAVFGADSVGIDLFGSSDSVASL